MRYMSILLASGTVALLTAGAAAAMDRHVIIVNNTSTTMNEFYAASVGVDNWQEDILGKDVLEPGDQVKVNVDDGTGYCKYDFRAVFDDGSEAVKKAVNVCNVGKFTFND